MNDIRTALRELADEGTPVSLGRAALTGLRRRRRRRAAVAGGALTVAAVAAFIPWYGAQRPDPAPVAESPGRYVVAAYADKARAWHLLDPRTGTYRQLGGTVAAVSPALDRAAVIDAEPGTVDLTLVGNAPGVPATTAVDLPRPPRSVQWSPDGTRLVVALASPTGTGGVVPWGFTQFAVVDVATGEWTMGDLDVGELRQAASIVWADDDTLVAAVSADADRPGDYEVHHTDGSLITRVPAPKGAHCGYLFDAGNLPAIRDGRVLACTRTPTELTLWSTGPLAVPGKATSVELARLPIEDTKFAVPLVWLDDDHMIMLREGIGYTMVDRTDVRTGALGRPAPGLPGDATDVVVAPATGLSPTSAGLAF